MKITKNVTTTKGYHGVIIADPATITPASMKQAVQWINYLGELFGTGAPPVQHPLFQRDTAKGI